jgi:hypothetical protein
MTAEDSGFTQPAERQSVNHDLEMCSAITGRLRFPRTLSVVSQGKAGFWPILPNAVLLTIVKRFRRQACSSLLTKKGERNDADSIRKLTKGVDMFLRRT